MAEITDDDHLFEDMTPESPGTIGRNIIKRLGLASQVANAIRSPNNNTRKIFSFQVVDKDSYTTNPLCFLAKGDNIQRQATKQYN